MLKRRSNRKTPRKGQIVTVIGKPRISGKVVEVVNESFVKFEVDFQPEPIGSAVSRLDWEGKA